METVARDRVEAVLIGINLGASDALRDRVKDGVAVDKAVLESLLRSFLSGIQLAIEYPKEAAILHAGGPGLLGEPAREIPIENLRENLFGPDPDQ
jgi:hypothetical protein